MKRDDAIAGAHEVPVLTRRNAVRLIGAALAAAPFASALGCGRDEGEGSDDDTLARTRNLDASVDCPAPDGGNSDASARTWASGGTAAMTALASYPNPFDKPVDSTCTPTCAMVLGPCHDDQAPDREDISEGQTGLPMRFGLRFLDEACAPVVDADVDIWHCDVKGIYSSETNDTPSFCTGNEPAALAARWFRGHQKTDANGVAWFSTCFPGWYRGRAIHIHYTVRRPDRDGEAYLTSQVGFPIALTQELCASHPDYADHGQPDTPLDADSIIPNDDRYVADCERMIDGALLATKTFILRSSLSADLCQEGGGGGPGGPGGFPGGDGGFPPGFPGGDGGFPPGFPGFDGGVPPRRDGGR